MKLFISWSGERSRTVARALREWLPLVLYYAEPWLSDRDIDAGERWANEVGKQLEVSHFGIVCLTSDNISAPWVLFEAGALSKQLSVGAVVPYLLDLDFGDLAGPLAQFQAKKAERDATRELVHSINGRASTAIPDDRLQVLFDTLWPKLEQTLRSIPDARLGRAPSRSTAEVLEELVATVRGFDHRLATLSAPAAPGPSAKRAGGARVGGHVVVRFEMPSPKIAEGNRIALSIADHFLDRFAGISGLPADEFGKTWHLRHGRSGTLLTQSDVADIVAYCDRMPGSLTVTGIPF